MKITLFILTIISTWSCVDQKNEKTIEEPVLYESEDVDNQSDSIPSSKDKGKSDAKFKGKQQKINRGPLVSHRISLYQGSLYSKRVDINKIDDLIRGVKGNNQRGLTLSDINYLFTLYRVGNKPFKDLFKMAKLVSYHQMKKDLEHSEISDRINLDLLVSGMYSHKWGQVAVQLLKLEQSSDKVVKSQLYNIRGILSLFESRYQSALEYFDLALQHNPSNSAASVNKGFLLLRFSFFDESLQILQKYSDDWMVKDALVSIYRFLGKADRANEICNELISQEDKKSSMLFNCGLFKLENMKDENTGIDLIKQSLAISGENKILARKIKKYLGALNIKK